MGGNFSIEDGDADKDITRKLQIRQTAVSTLLVIMFIGAVYGLAQTLVTGYCIVDAGVGGTSLPHAIWLIAPFVVSFGGAFVTRFEVGLYTETISSGIYFLYVLCVLNIVANAIALGFFVWELVQGVSNFYTLSFGFLVATIVITSLFIALSAILIAAAYIFHRDFVKALTAGWIPVYAGTNPLYYTKPKKEQPEPEENTPLLKASQMTLRSAYRKTLVK